MENMFELLEKMADPSFDISALKRHIFMDGEKIYTRTAAYAKAKEFRAACPLVFCRVLKVGDWYFVITNGSDWELYWEARKVAMRNERKKKNETI